MQTTGQRAWWPVQSNMVHSIATVSSNLRYVKYAGILTDPAHNGNGLFVIGKSGKPECKPYQVNREKANKLLNVAREKNLLSSVKGYDSQTNKVDLNQFITAQNDFYNRFQQEKAAKAAADKAARDAAKAARQGRRASSRRR